MSDPRELSLYFRQSSGDAMRLDRAPKSRIQILISFSLSLSPSLSLSLSCCGARLICVTATHRADTTLLSLSLSSLSLSLSFSLLCCERKKKERVKNERAIDGEDRTASRPCSRPESLTRASTNSRKGHRSVNRTSSLPSRCLSPILYLSRYLALSARRKGKRQHRLLRRRRIEIQSRRDPIDLPARRWSRPMTARADIADFPEVHPTA